MPQPPNPYEPPKEITQQSNIDSRQAPGDGAIRFAGQLSVRDAYAAGRLAKSRLRRVLSWIAWGLICLAPVLLAYIVIRDYLAVDAYYLSNHLKWLVITLTASVVSISLWLIKRSKIKRYHADGVAFFAYTEGLITENSIDSKTDTISSSVLWSTFCGYRKSNSVVLLFQAPGVGFHILSRTKFQSDRDWQRFIEIVESKLPLI